MAKDLPSVVRFLKINLIIPLALYSDRNWHGHTLRMSPCRFFSSKGGYSSIGRATVCGTVSSLFKSGYPPYLLYNKIKLVNYVHASATPISLRIIKFVHLTKQFHVQSSYCLQIHKLLYATLCTTYTLL